MKFSHFTQIEDFRKNSTHGEYIDKIQEASHGRIFTFLFNLDKNGEKEIGMTRVIPFISILDYILEHMGPVASCAISVDLVFDLFARK